MSNTKLLNGKLRLKDCADLDGTSLQMVSAMPVIGGVFASLGFDFTVTSGLDGEHSQMSYHYDGDAQDYRCWDVMDRFERVGKMIREALVMGLAYGTYFDVVCEYRTNDDGERIPSHYHVEFDRRKWEARAY